MILWVNFRGIASGKFGELVGGAITILKNMNVDGKDYPIYYGKYKLFETTNQWISG